MHRRGFTLIEVMVALAIGGMVLVAVARIFSGVADGGRELRTAREALDREMNARRWLKASFLSLEVGQVPGSSFEGHADRASFTTWQLVSGGWLEPERVSLASRGSTLVATVGTEAPIILSDSVTGLAFDYLLEPGLNASWVREWISPVSAPLAVRLRLQRGTMRVDTLLFLIKERG